MALLLSGSFFNAPIALAVGKTTNVASLTALVILLLRQSLGLKG